MRSLTVKKRAWIWQETNESAIKDWFADSFVWERSQRLRCSSPIRPTTSCQAAEKASGAHSWLLESRRSFLLTLLPPSPPLLPPPSSSSALFCPNSVGLLWSLVKDRSNGRRTGTRGKRMWWIIAGSMSSSGFTRSQTQFERNQKQKHFLNVRIVWQQQKRNVGEFIDLANFSKKHFLYVILHCSPPKTPYKRFHFHADTLYLYVCFWTFASHSSQFYLAFPGLGWELGHSPSQEGGWET